MGDSISIDVDAVGLEKARRALLKLGDAAVNDMKQVNKGAAEIVARRARTEAPRRSGRLAGDIRSSGTKARGIIRVGRKALPYAGPIHWGWPGRPRGKWRRGAGPQGGPIKANEFLTRAEKGTRRQVHAHYDRGIRALVRKHT